jgi:hypothetical protein
VALSEHAADSAVTFSARWRTLASISAPSSVVRVSKPVQTTELDGRNFIIWFGRPYHRSSMIVACVFHQELWFAPLGSDSFRSLTSAFTAACEAHVGTGRYVLGLHCFFAILLTPCGPSAPCAWIDRSDRATTTTFAVRQLLLRRDEQRARRACVLDRTRDRIACGPMFGFDLSCEVAQTTHKPLPMVCAAFLRQGGRTLSAGLRRHARGRLLALPL